MKEPDKQPEPHKTIWNTVTPVSKYLALALFVCLPFAGGWVGYKYAPVDLVETKQIVIEEKIVEVQKELSEDQRKKLYAEDIAIVLDGKLVTGYIGYRHAPVRGDIPNGLFEILPLFETDDNNPLLSSYVTLSTDTDSVYSMFINEMGGVFVELTKIPGADASSFTAVASTSDSNHGYYKDKNYVYYGGKRLVGANPKTFKVVTEERFYDRAIASDAADRYYRGQRIVKEFPRRLAPDRVDYLVTTTAVYYLFDTGRGSEVLQNANPDIFDVYRVAFEDESKIEKSARRNHPTIDQLGVSGEHVYYREDIVPNLSGDTLETYPLHFDSWHVMKDADTAYIFQPKDWNAPFAVPSLDTPEEMRVMSEKYWLGLHSTNSWGYSPHSIEAAFAEYGQKI